MNIHIYIHTFLDSWIGKIDDLRWCHQILGMKPWLCDLGSDVFHCPIGLDEGGIGRKAVSFSKAKKARLFSVWSSLKPVNPHQLRTAEEPRWRWLQQSIPEHFAGQHAARRWNWGWQFCSSTFETPKKPRNYLRAIKHDGNLPFIGWFLHLNLGWLLH